ncbi:hypothetical protein [Streptomyces sp. NBC_00557]|uniref:hypothetical protein n=1 Tax=Streptomyces sp. NBC_00557 TaxID=2975776 RepID=UPI002E817944|nr:hypothetical protein [Streptomyces sp. NBC_00557]WUC34422.1 hypothetical protein OG956_09475 [Streptomyces sp. NBC_00557]
MKLKPKLASVQTWEDDPGEPPIGRTPIQRPTPEVSHPSLPVSVAGEPPAESGDYPGSAEFRYWAAADAMSRASNFWGPLMPANTTWNGSVGQVLTAQLDSGDDLNAYYDRSGLCFFRHTVAGVTVHSGESPDVVCHEAGHAVLDALRPQFWGVLSAEVGAFHESFGDMSAILSSLGVGAVADEVLTETQGNPARSSRLSRLAEQLGWAIRQIDPSAVDRDCLRNAANNFFYRDPVTLRPSEPASQLSSEVHSFSRVFTGAFLDAVAGIFYQQPARDGDALVQAGQIMGRLLVAALLATPTVPALYAQVAAHMLAADKALYDGRYGPALRSAFVRHGILSPSEAVAADQAAPQHLAAITGVVPEPGADLGTVTVPAERYGLTEPFTASAPSEQPRFAVAGADPAIGSLTPADPAKAAETFIEDLFRQGRIAVADEFLTTSAAVVDGTRTRTHQVTRQDSGGLVLDRLLFL